MQSHGRDSLVIVFLLFVICFISFVKKSLERDMLVVAIGQIILVIYFAVFVVGTLLLWVYRIVQHGVVDKQRTKKEKHTEKSRQ